MHTTFNETIPYLNKIYALKTALTLFEWDNETTAPKAASDLTSKAVEFLSKEYYDSVTDPDLKKHVANLSSDDSLSFKEAAIIRELKKEYDAIDPIPSEDYIAYQGLIARAPAIWAEAKAKDDYSLFLPSLKEIICAQKSFAKKRIDAGHLDFSPYDLLLNDFEEGFTTKELDAFFDELKQAVIPLVRARRVQTDKSYNYKSYPIDIQKSINMKLLSHLGFDFDRGVIKESVHPFTTNLHNHDVRITTAYEECNLESAMFSTIHECGHALYEMHIDDDLTMTPVGCGASMGMHEGQSRLFENNLGRSRAFWVPLFDTLKTAYPKQLNNISLDDFIGGINRTTPGLIRTEADELTYSLHIIIRYEIEKAIFNDEIEPEDLPKLWNEKYKEYLGILPQKDSEGILQDIHWAGGSFGYFPSYALGNAIAAQIYAHLHQALPLDTLLENGDFETINTYLKEHLHHFGKTMTTDELLTQMTGEPFNPQYFISYLQKKYAV